MSDIPARVRPEIAALPPYQQGKQAGPDAFKLSSNENPFEPLPSVVAAVTAGAPVNRYPDATAGALRARLAEKWGVASDELHIGAGSVSILQQLVLAAAGHGDEVVYAWRSFEAYPWLPITSGATAVPVPLTADARHDLDAMADAVTARTRAILLCTPNNPTGPIITSADLATFLDRIPERVTVALDEAYYEYVRSEDPVDGVVEAMSRPNVVSLRTFSKAYGLAGLRVGYLVGPAEVVTSVAKMVVPFSVSSLAQAAGIACLEAGDELRARTDAVVAERIRVRESLLELGFPVPDSQANFVWLPLGERAEGFNSHCREHLVITRCFAGDGVRVSIGDADENNRFLAAAKAFVTGM